jgi:hypothetical protein
MYYDIRQSDSRPVSSRGTTSQLTVRPFPPDLARISHPHSSSLKEILLNGNNFMRHLNDLISVALVAINE